MCWEFEPQGREGRQGGGDYTGFHSLTAVTNPCVWTKNTGSNKLWEDQEGDSQHSAEQDVQCFESVVSAGTAHTVAACKGLAWLHSATVHAACAIHHRPVSHTTLELHHESQAWHAFYKSLNTLMVDGAGAATVAHQVHTLM